MDAHAESTRSESTPAGPNEFTYFYLWDQVGSVRVVANGQGVTVETHDYEPYGLEMPSPTCPSSSLMRYAGQERDYLTSDCSDTVDYMHYRFYASTIGRFMRPDNVSGNPMNPQDWNLYSYVHGNPVNFNDPTGHMTSASGQLGILGEGHGDPFNATDIDWSFVENPDQFQTRSTAKNMMATAGQGTTSSSTPGAPITLFGKDYSLKLDPPAPLPQNKQAKRFYWDEFIGASGEDFLFTVVCMGIGAGATGGPWGLVIGGGGAEVLYAIGSWHRPGEVNPWLWPETIQGVPPIPPQKMPTGMGTMYRSLPPMEPAGRTGTASAPGPPRPPIPPGVLIQAEVAP